MNHNRSIWFVRCLALALGAGSLVAQGTLARGIYTDKKLGFKFIAPSKWKQVPTMVDEKWIVAQFQSNREYEGHHKLDGDFVIHRPLMRVIQFDEKVIAEMVETHKSDDDTTIKGLKLPYRNYKDYLKRNYASGGYHFSQEKKIKVGKREVTFYEVKVEKLARGGRKQILTYVFKGEWGVDYAVQFEFLMHHFKKLRPQGLKTLKSFTMFKPANYGQTTGPTDDAAGTFGKWIRADWKKKTAKERHDLRKQIEKVRVEKSIAGLPQGWKVVRSKHFVVLTHASPKYTKRLVTAAEACWTWIEKRFDAMNDEYVSRGLLRICKNAEEYSAYRDSSADAFSLDDKEIALYEDKGAGNTGEWRGLFYAIFAHFMSDKDSLIYDNTPMWLSSGLIDYFAAARIKGRKIEFKVDEYEPEAFRDLRRKGVKPMMPRQLLEITSERMSKARKAKLEPDEQLVTFLRFLEGPARRLKMFKGKKDFVLRYLQESVVAAEKAKERFPATSSTNSAETEEEEEAQVKKKDRTYEKRREFICLEVNKVLCKWTEKEWKKFDQAYLYFLKKNKYL